MTAVIKQQAVSTLITPLPVATATPVRRLTPVPPVPAQAVHLLTATMGISVPMTVVIKQQAASMPTTLLPVMTATPVRRLTPARVEPVSVVPHRTVMISMPVPMTVVIKQQAVSTLITPFPVTTAMPVLQLTPARVEPVPVVPHRTVMISMSALMTAVIQQQAVSTLITPLPVMTAMPVLQLTPARVEPVRG